MSLTVESGAGAADSDAYISVAFADNFHSVRGNALWGTMSEPEKEQAIRRATDHLSRAYRERWKGCRATSIQALDWPRYDVRADGYDVASNVVPEDVRRACADLAFKAAAGDLAPDLEQNIISETIGPMTTQYDRTSPQYKRYRAIDLMLAPYLRGAGSISLVRA